jgi:hypothetical protein
LYKRLDLPEYHCIEDFSFTIVHKSLHKFKLGQFTGNDYGGFSVTFEECMESEDYMFLDHWTYFVLGKGSNEEDAWIDALHRIISNWYAEGNLSIDDKYKRGFYSY